MNYRIGGWSDTGKRTKNDDFFVIDIDHNVAAVSDGISGAPFGNVASRVACNTAIEVFRNHEGCDVETLFDRAFEEASEKTRQVLKWLGADANDAGATLLMVSWGDDGIIRVANAGDSAFVEIRNGCASLLTIPDRVQGTCNELSKGIGRSLDYRPMKYDVECTEGVLYIACTDGVWGVFGEYGNAGLETELANCIYEADTVSHAALLAAEWGARKGTDNATAVVIAPESPVVHL